MTHTTSSDSKTAVLALTEGGRILAEKIAGKTGADVYFCRGKLKKTMGSIWGIYDGLIFIMATGIVIRIIAPLLESKHSDPAVVVGDEKGRFVISLLSGHIGGGNDLAYQVAAITGGTAVITTSSDVLHHTAIDLWIRDKKLTVSSYSALTTIMGRLVNDGSISLYSDYPLTDIPDDFTTVESPDTADLVISCRTDIQSNGVLLYPKTLVAGIGCNRGTPAENIEKALRATCSKHHIAMESIINLASIDVKNDEPGLLEFALNNGYAIDYFNRDELNNVKDISVSAAVMKAVGAKGVAEPAAILSAHNGKLRVRKEKWTDVTVAIAEVVIAEENSQLSEQDQDLLTT